MDLGLSGLASGFDWRTLIDQLMEVERAPQRRLRVEQTDLGDRSNAYDFLTTQLNALKSSIDALKSPSLFDTRTTKAGDSTILSASATAAAAAGVYNFSITQLATASSQQVGANAGLPLSATNDDSGLV